MTNWKGLIWMGLGWLGFLLSSFYVIIILDKFPIISTVLVVLSFFIQALAVADYEAELNDK